jgi:hypothetical protein
VRSLALGLVAVSDAAGMPRKSCCSEGPLLHVFQHSCKHRLSKGEHSLLYSERKDFERARSAWP